MLSLYADDGPALRLDGQNFGAKVTIEVEALDLAFDLGPITVAERALIGRVRFDPHEWLERLGVEDGEAVVIGPDSPRYDELLDAIERTTEYGYGAGGDDDHEETE